MTDHDVGRGLMCEIARCAFEVVSGLLSRDQRLAAELRSSETGSRQIFGEECITVELAATLRERYRDHVQITLFTHPEETRTGADWYWRFERGGRAIHARVQAKRVRRSAFGDSDDRGRVEIDDGQLARLLEGVPEDELPSLQAWVATYARFNAIPPCGKSRLSTCRHHCHGGSCPTPEPALWIAQAGELRSLARSPSVQQVVERSVRLDCVLPCMDGRDPQAYAGPTDKGFALT